MPRPEASADDPARRRSVADLAWRWPAVALLAAGGIWLATGVGGCGSPAPPVINVEEGPQSGERCAAMLASGLEQVRPETLGIKATPDDAADSLTRWLNLEDCIKAAPVEPLDGTARELLTRLLGKEGPEQVETNRLTPRDAEHVRNALLDYRAAGAVAAGATDELDQALRTFAYVVRTVLPAGPSSQALPLSPYEVRLFGRGTAEDRAVVFANLLRQLKLDAVILRPAGEADGPWWIGVPIGGEVSLFDAELGLPVPAAGSSVAGPPTLMPKPATWGETVADPALLSEYRRTAGLLAPAVSAESLKAPRVGLISAAPARRQAMERLEQSLTVEGGVLLADPLQTTAAGPGLFRRIAEAGRRAGLWDEAAISVWDYPDRRADARDRLGEADRRRIESRLDPFRGPIEVDVDKATGQAAAKRSNRLWETRVLQLGGGSGRAIGSYLSIRGADLPEGVPPAIAALNAASADDAFYDVIQAQYDQGDYAAAAQTAQNYLTRRGGRSDEAAGLFVSSVAALGATADAAAIVAQLPPSVPDLPRYRWLASRWRKPPSNGSPRPAPPAAVAPASPLPQEPVVAPKPSAQQTATGNAVAPVVAPKP